MRNKTNRELKEGDDKIYIFYIYIYKMDFLNPLSNTKTLYIEHMNE